MGRLGSQKANHKYASRTWDRTTNRWRYNYGGGSTTEFNFKRANPSRAKAHARVSGRKPNIFSGARGR